MPGPGAVVPGKKASSVAIALSAGRGPRRSAWPRPKEPVSGCPAARACSIACVAASAAASKSPR